MKFAAPADEAEASCARAACPFNRCGWRSQRRRANLFGDCPNVRLWASEKPTSRTATRWFEYRDELFRKWRLGPSAIRWLWSRYERFLG